MAKKSTSKSSELNKFKKKVQDAKKSHKTAEGNTKLATKKVDQAQKALKKAATVATKKKNKATANAKTRAAAAVQKAKAQVINMKAKAKVTQTKVKDAEFEYGLMAKKNSIMEKAIAAFTRKWEREFNADVREKLAARQAKKTKKPAKKVSKAKAAPKPAQKMTSKPTLTISSKPADEEKSGLDAAIAAEFAGENEPDSNNKFEDSASGDNSEDYKNDPDQNNSY